MAVIHNIKLTDIRIMRTFFVSGEREIYRSPWDYSDIIDRDRKSPILLPSEAFEEANAVFMALDRVLRPQNGFVTNSSIDEFLSPITHVTRRVDVDVTNYIIHSGNLHYKSKGREGNSLSVSERSVAVTCFYKEDQGKSTSGMNRLDQKIFSRGEEAFLVYRPLFDAMLVAAVNTQDTTQPTIDLLIPEIAIEVFIKEQRRLLRLARRNGASMDKINRLALQKAMVHGVNIKLDTAVVLFYIQQRKLQ